MKRFAIIILFAAFISFCVVAGVTAGDASSARAQQTSSVTLQTAEEEKEDADKKEADSEKKADEDEDSEKKSDDAAESKEDSAAEKTEEKADAKPAADEAGKEEQKPADDAEKDKSAAKSDEKPAAKPEAKKRKTHKVEPKRMKIDITLEGTFVASKMEEVPLRPDAWTTYKIVEAVEHGAKVRNGETLMKFDREKLDEAIADLELEQRLNELAILRSEEELPRMEKTLKLDFEEAERSNQQAKEDFERYKEIERPMAVKAAEFMVKYYDFVLSYEKDELEQLEKMYEADDLTEDTEEIILKRQRNYVEFAEFSLENAKLSRDQTLKVRLPRTDIRIKDLLERAGLAQARAKMALALDLNRAHYEMEQRKKARTKSLDRHTKLLKDRGLMEIKSPADGIVFYGQNVNGRWSDTSTLINKYKPENNVTPGSIVMTIVEPRPLFVLSSIDEGKRPDVSDGQKAKIVLPAEGADRVGGEVKSISPIPVSQGKFEVNFEVSQDEVPDWIAPGMSCKVQVTTYDKKDALVVPKAAVHDDEDDEDKKYVWLVDPDDEEAKPERRDVKIGKRKGDDIEIVKGLKKDEVVSLDDESEKAKKES